MLTRTWDNKLDWWAFSVCLGLAVLQILMVGSVILAFKHARSAGLNIGIITAIWSFIPFGVAALERIIYGISIKLFQIVGMLAIVVMAILVSLSDLFSPDANVETLTDDHKRTPIYIAVLIGLIFPAIATYWFILVKYMHKTLKLETMDWIKGYFLISAVILTAIGIVFFYKHEGTFRWTYFYQGCISGLGTMTGTILAVYALNVDKAPQGPTTAMINTRIVLIVIFDSIFSKTYPTGI